MLPLYLHVNQKSDYDDIMIMITYNNRANGSDFFYNFAFMGPGTR